MSKTRYCLRFCLVGALALTTPAYADRVAVTCQDTPVSRAGNIALVYEGGASGTLHIKGAMGELTLPANKEQAAGAIGIRAFGTATAMMPDKRALEACIAGRSEPGTAQDADLHALNLLACRERMPETTPTPVRARVDISIDDPPLANVFVSRTYQDRSSLPGSPLAIESVPPPACRVSSPN